MQPLRQWKTNKYYIFWVCICNLRYPARNSHAPYCHWWPVRLYNIFPHYKRQDFRGKKMSLNKKCVFWCTLWFWFEAFFILRRIQQDIIKNMYWSSCKVGVIHFQTRHSRCVEYTIKYNIKYTHIYTRWFRRNLHYFGKW